MRRFIGVAAAVLVFLANPPGRVVALATAEDTDGAVLSRSLAQAEERFGPASPQLLPILAPLAQLRFQHAKLAEATALRRRALKIAIGAYGSGAVPAADAMAALARLYIVQRRYLDAEPLDIAATNVLSDRLDASNPVLAPVLADRARIALARGDDGDARKWAEEALAIDRKNGGAPAADRLRVLGAVLVAQGRFAESEATLRRALALDRARGEPLATARSLTRLGNAYMRQSSFVTALPLIEEATFLDQTHLGVGHPLIAEDFHNLGLLYLATNRPADAARAFNTAIDVLERGAGRGTPDIAYIELDLARAELALGHDRKEQSLFDDARNILIAASDEESDRERKA